MSTVIASTGPKKTREELMNEAQEFVKTLDDSLLHNHIDPGANRDLFKRQAAVFECIKRSLTKLGHDTSEFPSKLDGIHISFYISEERSSGDFYTRDKGTGRLRAKIGNYGNVRQYPEGKNGLKLANLLEALVSEVASCKRDRDKRCVEQGNLASSCKLLLQLADEVGEKLDGYTREALASNNYASVTMGPATFHANKNHADHVSMEMHVVVTKEQAKLLIAALKSAGFKMEKVF